MTEVAGFDEGFKAWRERRFPEAFAILHPLAEAGNARAQVLVGLMCDEGRGTTTDPAAAVTWLRKGAAQGDAIGQFHLAQRLRGGAATPEQRAEAVSLLRQSAEQGFPPAMGLLGILFSEGEGVDRNDEEAVKWLTRGARVGDPVCQNHLGVRHANGEGLPKDPAAARNWFLKASELGFPPAMFNLALALARGEDAPPDIAKATEWMTKSAEGGYEPAQFHLGIGLLRDRTSPETIARGIELLLRSAQAGFPKARQAVADLMAEMDVEDGAALAAALTGQPSTPSTAGDADARVQHYQFAHCILPSLAHEDPEGFFAHLDEEGSALLLPMWEEARKNTPDLPPIDPTGLSLKRFADAGYQVAVVTLPPPERTPEAHLILVAHLDGAARVFALEYHDLEGTHPSTVFGEWTREGRHLHRGPGPRPDPDAFWAHVKAFLQTPG